MQKNVQEGINNFTSLSMEDCYNHQTKQLHFLLKQFYRKVLFNMSIAFFCVCAGILSQWHFYLSCTHKKKLHNVTLARLMLSGNWQLQPVTLPVIKCSTAPLTIAKFLQKGNLFIFQHKTLLVHLISFTLKPRDMYDERNFATPKKVTRQSVRWKFELNELNQACCEYTSLHLIVISITCKEKRYFHLRAGIFWGTLINFQRERVKVLKVTFAGSKLLIYQINKFQICLIFPSKVHAYKHEKYLNASAIVLI